MSGVHRVLWLPFMAMVLLLLGCGVPITPAEITATAVADEATTSSAALGSSFGASSSNDTAQSLRSGSSAVIAPTTQTADAISTVAVPTVTSTPGDATPAASGTPEASPTTEATPEDGSTPEVTAEAPETATPAGTPTATPTPEPTATPAPVVQNINGDFAQEFLTLLNAQRTGRGMQALTYNAVLAAGATKYAEYMGTSDFFGHDAPDGSTPASRATSTGYPGAWNGEALSAGQPTPQIALNALLASAPHAAILLDPKSVEVGIGYAYVANSHYRSYWVIMTGIP